MEFIIIFIYVKLFMLKKLIYLQSFIELYFIRGMIFFYSQKFFENVSKMKIKEKKSEFDYFGEDVNFFEENQPNFVGF